MPKSTPPTGTPEPELGDEIQETARDASRALLQINYSGKTSWGNTASEAWPITKSPLRGGLSCGMMGRLVGVDLRIVAHSPEALKARPRGSVRPCRARLISHGRYGTRTKCRNADHTSHDGSRESRTSQIECHALGVAIRLNPAALVR